MAVKLSSVSAGSTVQIPMSQGDTFPAVVIEYNHYGKGEVTLATKDEYVMYGIRGMVNFVTTQAHAPIVPYISCDADSWLLERFPYRLADSIRGALVNVQLPIGQILTISEDGMTTVNCLRSVFLPSLAELGITNVYYGTSLRTDPIKLGTKFSYFTTSTVSKLYEGADYRGWTRDTVDIWRSQTDHGSTSFRCTPNLIRRSNSSTTEMLIGTMYDSDSGYGSIGSGIVFFCLNGNIMVNSVSGGAITESSAVESYRKIGGKWYRTT